jgi:hypothetical protein
MSFGSPEVLVSGDKMECSCCKIVLTSLAESTNLLGGTLRNDDDCDGETRIMNNMNIIE